MIRHLRNIGVLVSKGILRLIDSRVSQSFIASRAVLELRASFYSLIRNWGIL